MNGTRKGEFLLTRPKASKSMDILMPFGVAAVYNVIVGESSVPMLSMKRFEGEVKVKNAQGASLSQQRPLLPLRPQRTTATGQLTT
jgi:hypothetical protein